MESRRRRSALTLSAIAALVVAAPLLTACGNDAHPGAAAIVKGDRISTAQLQSRVGAVRDAQRGAPQGEQMIKQSGQLTRATLDGMIRDRIVQQAAKDSGVHLTRRDVERARSQIERQAGGRKQLEATLLRQQAIAPDEIDSRIRMQLRVEKLAAAKGIDPASPQGNQQLNAVLAKTSKAMKINVNPRYGAWNAGKSTLAGAKTPWLRDLSGAAADRKQQM
ncbi:MULTISPECIES: SurA N-terminal domain-containing protein [unclassified Streptomyces]|uniref:SurA N-terminal domain-containing protein n=1 Tax=unclassified Streptomyces TaxID=2593676 RepID=UPI002DDA9366|nr:MULTISPECIES: SurA N-terminal domain-containing protein [unclassified Streptomyces]WSA94270.1 SurA N-terminal domain-containing protein [Streptomyces sp. NBC_01795]WSB78687.1 SurA N-terminal domain-containing protein [Streptomyces sp. NBC_01775]WSS13108.1 SurA N-terminal domain-containing protein [Streptomyces sp. NBC_01186]WSS41892.1 SurA N-terminal domain-containing protein [Streptomyces sp. NBC_01187]